MKKIRNYISIVIPVYNSEKTLVELINNLTNSLSIFDDYEIIFVDDNSKDESYRVLKRQAINDEHITVIRLGENLGQQRATFIGLTKAIGDYVVIIDDDLSHKTSDIIKLYERLEDGYDVVYGINKNTPNTTSIRTIGSKMRDKIFDKITDKPKHIKVSSFRIMKAEIVKKVCNNDNKFIYISMDILRHTTNIDNIRLDYQKGGPTNYNIRKLASLYIGIYVYYSKNKLVKLLCKKFKGYKATSIIEKGLEICE